METVRLVVWLSLLSLDIAAGLGVAGGFCAGGVSRDGGDGDPSCGFLGSSSVLGGGVGKSIGAIGFGISKGFALADSAPSGDVGGVKGAVFAARD